ncbi:MAG: 6-carboxytetrahydropterin synthase [Myxococcota bacterium]|jgi:6-pyruvoyltetrahydropterin/6-carboxytetrahydropterin synthase|nr:6-carboxytetrahydropterin synthase [Myxococcota bacterium]
MFRVTQDGWISSSHQLRLDDGLLEPLHGHNWRIQVAIEADELDERGLVIDLERLAAILTDVLDGLDHVHLNDLPVFRKRPVSAENVARHIADTIAAIVDDGRRRLAEVRVWMTEEQSASYARQASTPAGTRTTGGSVGG